MISPTYLQLLEELADLHRRKNAGYSGDDPDPWMNFRRCEAFGIPTEHGVITRMADKWGRFQSLYANPAHEQVGEALEDTVLDLAAYALMFLAMRREAAERVRYATATLEMLREEEAA